MIYVCNHCGFEIPYLKTPGDVVNKNLICHACSKDIDELLKKAKEIQAAIQSHIERIP